MILPDRVLGSPGAHCRMSGAAKGPISPRTHLISALRSSSLGCASEVRVT